MRSFPSTSAIRVLTAAGAAMIAANASAQVDPPRPDIESTMREIQARLRLFDLSADWEPCDPLMCNDCPVVPEMPPTMWYNEPRAEYWVTIVQDVVEEMSALDGLFLRPDCAQDFPDSCTGTDCGLVIEDDGYWFCIDAPDYWYYVQNPGEITTENYSDVIDEMDDVLLDLTYFLSTTPGTKDLESIGGGVMGNEWIEVTDPPWETCQDAVDEFLEELEDLLWDDWDDPVGNIGIFVAGASDLFGDPLTWHIQGYQSQATRGRITNNPDGEAQDEGIFDPALGSGVVEIYLTVAEEADGEGPIPAPVSDTGDWEHYVTVSATSHWQTTNPLADPETMMAPPCQCESGCSEEQGWRITGVIGVVEVLSFNTTADEAEQCTFEPFEDEEEDVPENDGNVRDDCSDDGVSPEESGGGKILEHPVAIGTGHKIERAVDLSVNVSGETFTLARHYSSNPDLYGSYGGSQGQDSWYYNNFGLVGTNWSMTPFRHVQTNGDGDPVIVGPPMHIGVVFREDANNSSLFVSDGPGSQYVLATTNGDGDEIWRHVEPGVGETDYYRFDDQASEFNEALDGRLLARRDIYGNEQIFQYSIWGPSTGIQEARPVVITFKDAGEATEATVYFTWIEPDFDVHKHLWLRLEEVAVTRPNGVSDELVQLVEYFYNEDHPDPEIEDTPYPGFLGGFGDLILVKSTDLTLASPHSLYTHYRYHDGEAYVDPPEGDERFTIEGQEHQLKAVFQPEQIEFYFQKINVDQSITIADALNDLLFEYEDDDAVTDWDSTETDPLLFDLAAKIIGYKKGDVEGYAEQDAVDVQFIQSACGCGGGATQGMMQLYRFKYNNEVATAYPTMVVREVLADEETAQVGDYEMTEGATPQFKAYRRRYYEMEDASGYRRLVRSAIVEGHIDETQGTLPPDSNRKWVTAFEYDDRGRLVRKIHPSAVAFWYGPEEENLGVQIIGYDSNGLVEGFVYAGSDTGDEPDDNYLTETRIRDGYNADVSTYTVISETEYGDPNNDADERTYLPKAVRHFRVASTNPGGVGAADIEETTFEYGFHAGDALAFISMTVEAEDPGENGPDGVYTSHELFNEHGENVWSHAADDALIYRAFDAATGRVTKIVNNADPTAPDGDSSAALDGADFANVTTTGWGRFADGGELTTTHVYDLLGRRVKSTSPGDVDGFVDYSLEPESVGRNGWYYRAETRLPFELSDGSFNGPAMRTWFDADGHAIRVSSFEINDSQTYDPEGGTYTLGDELTRKTMTHRISGLVEKSTVWHDIQNDYVSSPNDRYETAFEYDSLGRRTVVANPVGTIQRTTYDVLDRPTAVEIGTDLDDQTGDMVVVREMFYDHDMIGSDPVQGVGDGNLTLTRAHTGEIDGQDEIVRDVETEYDFRNRPVKTVHPEAPHHYVVYDNLDRPIEEAIFSSEPTAIDAPLADRGSHTISHYSQRGKPYRRQMALDPTDGQSPIEYLESHTWYDEVGRAISEWNPNSGGVKRTFDGLGRVKTQYLTDRRGDGAPGSGSYTHATNVTGDWIIEQSATQYNDAGMPELMTTLLRLHDDTATGALSAADSIATYVGVYYDDAQRRIRTVNFGTNDSDGFVSDGAEPSWPPQSTPDFDDEDYDDEAIVTAVSYNSRGLSASTTDPEGRIDVVIYDDMNRPIVTIESQSAVDEDDLEWSSGEGRWYIDETLSDDEDRVTSIVYDGAGNVVKQIAHTEGVAPANDDQVTTYVYGSTLGSPGQPTDSLVASYDLLVQIILPDVEGSETEPDHSIYYAYNALGELRAATDQNGTVHTYDRDLLGRVIGDRVSLAMGSDIDSAVLGIGVVFDGFGRIETVESFDDDDLANAGVVNGVEFAYTPSWQIEKIYQNHAGEVTYSGGAPTGDTELVAYTFDEAEIDGTYSTGNYSRVESLTYPDGAELEYVYGYGTMSELDDRLSRVSAIQRQGEYTHLAAYEYIGSGMAAIVDYPTVDVRLDFTRNHVGEAPDEAYPGFDQWGRVLRQMWTDGGFDEHASSTTVPNLPPIVEEVYAYNRASSRTQRFDVRPGAQIADRDFVFEYDLLDRLKEARRGVDDGQGDVTLANGSHQWGLDVLGNWTSFRTDRNANGVYTNPFVDWSDLRTHNDGNEIKTRNVSMGSTSYNSTHTQDKAGNRRTEGVGGATNTYTYDAWNRLVEVKQGNSSGTYTIGEYEYNGLHWRTVRNFDDETPFDGIDSTDDHRVLYYDGAWRLLEERIDNDGSAGVDEIAQQFWGVRYIDDPVQRRRDLDADGWDAGDPAYYHLTDAQFSTVAMIDDAGALQERVFYSPYGRGTHRWAGDVDGDGDVDSNDVSAVTTLAGANGGQGTAIEESTYDVDADLNRDGVVDGTDTGIISALPSESFLAGEISDADGPDNLIGYSGYLFDRESSHYLVRRRNLDPATGRWLQRDPIGYADGLNLFQYSFSSPLTFVDSTGLKGQPVLIKGPRSEAGEYRVAARAFSKTIGDIEYLDGQALFLVWNIVATNNSLTWTVSARLDGWEMAHNIRDLAGWSTHYYGTIATTGAPTNSIKIICDEDGATTEDPAMKVFRLAASTAFETRIGTGDRVPRGWEFLGNMTSLRPIKRAYVLAAFSNFAIDRYGNGKVSIDLYGRATLTEYTNFAKALLVSGAINMGKFGVSVGMGGAIPLDTIRIGGNAPTLQADTGTLGLGRWVWECRSCDE